jgi:hypothetical protein
MGDGIHKVVLYVNQSERLFTITARMDRARLPGVDGQMSRPGWTRTLLAERLNKHEAEELRNRERAEWEAGGYTYQTRPQLS